MPVIYRYYVVALIFLINNHQKNSKMDQRILDYTWQFSRIMTYTLKINGYFNNEIGPKDSYKIPIYDLSPGGVGFYVENDQLEEKLILDQNIRISLIIDNRQIRILAKLVRKFQNLSRYFYGFVFLEIKTDDSAFLNKLLYQSKTF
jgi:c-di-GMP-binding flagellar brake protein YcgR